ncbi:Membrane fusion component of tripartite multidrug resistance system [Georgfuchsia toluolica]|uniref:Membrane fusion component of tripartite multidrug resistance system n=1 Tax=Georgfuchsia toluolica TaxID=424218 RepID=A0A916J1P3_9PROT|nr:HlyD family secretion protein [Georgfuchsia toluolica]CAG4882505.1 Membrane fusion component of tripartite multidrug resistance system [Georgfuchsia toluolica]
MSDIPSGDDEPPFYTASLSQRQTKRLVLLVVIPLIAALVIAVLYLHGGRYVETDNAYVKADMVPVSADVSGTIKEVLVQENQSVVAGQPLFRIDPASFQVAVAKAEAKLAQVRTDLAALQASYREKQAEIALAKTRHAFAQREQRRQADLVDRHFISASRFDDATQSADIARQQIAALNQDLKRIAETLGGNIDTPIEHHPGYRAASAELDQARLDLARTEVRASLPGTVSNRPKPGQYLAAGSAAMALVVSGSVWVEANFTETDLTYVRPGESVVIHVDTYPDTVWKGVVDSLSPATGAEFSVIPAQNATGNWVKITQRVPVRIKLDAAPGQPALRAGLSTIVNIDTGHRRRFMGLSL